MLILSADTLERLSKEKEEENLEFITRLKNIPARSFDDVVTPLAQHFTEKIDCTDCANCCNSVYVGVTVTEASVLARKYDRAHGDFISEMVEMEPDGSGGYLKERPCIFLKGKMCEIYADRPASCKSYPGLHGTQLKYRIRRIMDEYSVCPIVYHTIEHAKKILKNN
jgi:Fe-S-cluster containining protein